MLTHLGPAGRGVGHHSNVLALITEILGQGDTGVDGGLPGSHGHVGGIGHQARALHNGDLHTVEVVRELGELHEHLSHLQKKATHCSEYVVVGSPRLFENKNADLITALSTADINNAVCVSVLGQGLRDAGLAAAERPGDSTGASEHRREQGVEDTLASQQRGHGGELLLVRSRLADGPVEKRQRNHVRRRVA